MFMGEYQHTLDSKDRLIIPAKFRDLIGDDFVVTRWLDQSLCAFSQAEFQALQAKLNQLPIGKKTTRQFRALIFASAMTARFDKQGRILLPTTLKTYANITKTVAITGNGTSFQIWDEAIWRKYQAAANQEFDAIAEELTDFDF